MKYLKTLCVVLCIGFLLTACKKECVHEYQSQITAQATCTQEGVETFTCTLCQDSYTQPVPIVEHTYAFAEIEKEATCTEEGLQLNRCTACNAEERIAIEKIPHTLENATVVKKPNCTQEGEACGDCTVCGGQQVTVAVATNDVHIFTNKVVKEATCTEIGEGLNICTLCEHQEPCQYELKEHTYNKNVLTKAGCKKDGQQECICTVCGYYIKETIPAYGHSWRGATCQTAAVCATCGATGSKSGHNYITIETQNPSENYLGHRVKQCSTCQTEKTEYFGNYYSSYDMDAIAAEIAAYARSKGFKVEIGPFYYDTNSGSPYRSKRTYRPYFLEVPNGGPNRVIREGKESVDYIYGELTDDVPNPALNIERRILRISVTYSEKAIIGIGQLQCHIQAFRISTEDGSQG